jgi:D-alanyl-D-alanine endopeptidase (penicillin-binding protein 7)
MKGRIIKYLFIGVLIWLISASYGHYVSYASSGKSLWGNDSENIIASFWERVFPGSLNIKARAALVVDASTGEVIYAKHEHKQMPIASLTKLATALIYLKFDPDLTNMINITQADFPPVAGSKLYEGETISARDCFHLCLMCSDNVAANALARATGISRAEFVSEMNRLADNFDMSKTRFIEPTGLDSGNLSCAADYIKLVDKAYKNPVIAEVSSKKSYQFSAVNRNITHTLYNTNRLLYSRWQVIGGKTGYISQSGYCLAVDAIDASGRQINAVILGAPSNHYRYRDASRLLAYAGKN